MRVSNQFVLVFGLAAAFGAVPFSAMAQENKNAGSVQEAAKFEKAKQAAAERQERMDDGLTKSSAPAASKSATPSKFKTSPKANSASLRKPAQPR